MRFFHFIFIGILTVLIVSGCEDAAETRKPIPKYTPATRKEVTFSFAPIVKKVAPAVVNIYASRENKLNFDKSPFTNDPFFQQFFEKFYGKENFTKELNSLGSGVLVSPSGLILSNYHVVENAETIRIALADKREFNAKIISTDKRTDLVLLQIEKQEQTFPYLDIEPINDLEVGDIVLAIGNPFGVGQTVTSGIVSALARSPEGISDFRSFIQTDAAINPGNSGGALVTTNGQLVGINTAIFSRSGGSIGIGFAIPVSLAIPIIESSKNGGHVIRPWSGMQVESLGEKEAKALGLSRSFGALVKKVYPKSTAANAGIRIGDLITAFDGKEIEDDAAFDFLIATASIDKEAVLDIFRKGKSSKMVLLLEAPRKAKDASELLVKGKNPFQGTTIRNLSPALAVDIGLNPFVEGVVITQIDPGSPAANLKFKPLDVIQSINGHNIKSKKDFLISQKKSKKQWKVIFRRGRNIITLKINNLKTTRGM